MTNRLIAIAVISSLMLLTLLFFLGFQLGQQWGIEEAKTQHSTAQKAQPYVQTIGVPAKTSLHAMDAGQPSTTDMPSTVPAPATPVITATTR